MCGIIGYIGAHDCRDILLEGLRRLEYRGYDSVGIATANSGNLNLLRRTGYVESIAEPLEDARYAAMCGIGHTRWATHGDPSERNAHPHLDGSGRFAIVHNGIVENYRELRQKLAARGHSFRSETDSEIIAHLIEEFAGEEPVTALRLALQDIVGSYGLVLIDRNNPDTLIAARKSSPLLIGKTDHGHLVASDISAVLPWTNEVCYLDDGEIATLNASAFRTVTLENVPVAKNLQQVQISLAETDKGDHAFYMEKEILEQGAALSDLFRGRIGDGSSDVKLGGLESLPLPDRITIVACGSSWHAGLIGEYCIEEIARLPVEVEYASEFRYRNPVLNPNSWVVAASQSGETLDTLAAVNLAKECGLKVIGIVNTVASAIARDADAGMYLHAGQEFGVAATKTFTAQVATFMLLAIWLGRRNGALSETDARQRLNELRAMPKILTPLARQREHIADIAGRYAKSSNFLYLGRGLHFPVALEGALKLKEISYIHAEGYPAAEMKHGPIALIDQDMPTVFIAPRDETYDKIMGNMQEINARGGKIIALTSEGNTDIRQIADEIIELPDTPAWLSPLTSVIPLQWLSYYIALERNCNVDRPRNLAKSVTVE
jgi:glutamine---fructose-6-phosphate transaminase (isomerizing)